MKIYVHHNVLFIVAVVIFCIFIFVSLEFLYIKFNGDPVPAPEIPRQAVTVGSGKPLTYVILGDSTAVSQGGKYEQGIAVASANFLGRSHTVTYHNFGQVGARTTDVASKQLGQAVKLAPDVVLVAVGANDVTHLTPLHNLKFSMSEIITKLKATNPEVKIVLTGSPQMGSVPRFPWPVRDFAKYRTAQVNSVIKDFIEPGVIMAPIAHETGPLFEKDRGLFAQDNFHPNSEGYKTWTPVITKALEEIMHD